jgi:hypothetical protein
MATVREIVFDCERAALLARFWAAALDGYEVRPYDDAEVLQLAALGLTPSSDSGRDNAPKPASLSRSTTIATD